MSVVKDVLMYGTNAARPAASSSNDGKFYRETDTGKTYQSNGSSWTLVADNSAISTIVSDWKESVRVATTANITLSGTQTIDGVSVIAGDRVLVKDQSTGANNGIYVCASGAWSRATDADTSAKVTADLGVFVEEGTANGDKIFILTTNNPITLASTSLTFTALATGGAGSDTSAIHDNESGEISALTEKTTLHNDDLFIIEDSEAGNVKKKVKKSNVGGGGSAFTQTVNEDGSSFANFTGASGTWSSDGTVIKQTNTSASQRRAKYNTKVVVGMIVFEAEVQLRTANGYIGLLIGFDGTNQGGQFAYIRDNTDSIIIEVEAVSTKLTVSTTIALNTWYKIRMVASGGMVTVYLDGTVIGSAPVGYASGLNDISYIGLWTYATEGWFRNVKAWNLTLPA